MILKYSWVTHWHCSYTISQLFFSGMLRIPRRLKYLKASCRHVAIVSSNFKSLQRAEESVMWKEPLEREIPFHFSIEQLFFYRAHTPPSERESWLLLSCSWAFKLNSPNWNKAAGPTDTVLKTGSENGGVSESWHWGNNLGRRIKEF